MTTKVESLAHGLINTATGATGVTLILATLMVLTSDLLTAIASFFWLSLFLLGTIAYYVSQIWSEVTKNEVGE